MVGVFVWMRRFRSSISRAFEEMLLERTEESKRIKEILENLHKRQNAYEGHLHKLAESHLQMKHDLISVSTRLENNERYSSQEQRILH